MEYKEFRDIFIKSEIFRDDKYYIEAIDMLYNILNGYGLKEDEVKEYSEVFHVGFFLVNRQGEMKL